METNRNPSMLSAEIGSLEEFLAFAERILAIKASEWHGTLQDLAAAGEINPDHIDDIMESAIDVGARSVFEQLPRVEALLSRRPKRKEN